MHPLEADCRVGARRRPLDPLENGNSPTGSGRSVEIHGYDSPVAVPRESVQYCRWYVYADIHSESTWFAIRPEPEVARPETEIAPVAGPSFGDIAAVSSRSQSVESESEAGVDPQSGYPLQARQEPEITPVPFHPIANPIRLSQVLQKT